MSESRRGILSLALEELAQWFERQGEAAYRARQVRQWILRCRARDFAVMSDLPKELRERLAQEFVPLETRVLDAAQADEEGTTKLLVELADGKAVECVVMRSGERRTVCVSTQVGCAMGCVFCASGLAGVERNLAAHEIVEQFLHAQWTFGPQHRITHAVIMGMGEPLANLDRLLKALRTVCSKESLGLSQRRITISTVGLPAAIRRLADADVRFHLAISLHAPNDRLRDQLVPVNRRCPITEVIAAADYFFARTGRQVTYEYVLLNGLNDRSEHARQLARLLGDRPVHINLIPYNPVAGLPYETPSEQAVRQFASLLRRYGFVVHVRKTKGRRIEAACGQLRLRRVPPAEVHAAH